MGIFMTNVLPCGANDSSTGAIASEGGLFLTCSRFNSDCSPNVHNEWDARKEEMVFRALKDIKEGDDLCITYVVQWLTREHRRQRLAKSFNFPCQCATCSLEGKELRDSDNRRILLAKLRDEIGECGSDPTRGVNKVSFPPISENTVFIC